MSFATIDETRVYYRLEGNPGLPVLVLSHSIGADHGLWEQQMPDLTPWILPHLIWIGLGLALVLIARLSFKRFRNIPS